MLIILVIFFEVLIIYNLINKISKKDSNIKKIFLISLIINFIILILYRIELSSLGREVYFSDSQVYWDATKSIFNGEKIKTWNMGYVYYSYIILKFSIFKNAALINISNMFLVYISILMLTSIMIKKNIDIINVKIFAILNMFNSLIFYSLFRNLKDALFLFYTVLIILLVDKFFEVSNKKHKVIIMFPIFIITLFLQSIRPWGFIIPISTFVIGMLLLLRKNYNKKNIIFVIISILSIGLIVLNTQLKGTLVSWVPIVLKKGLNRSFMGLILAPMKLIVGPGPVRSIMGNKYFLFTTTIGNIACFLGSLIWWFYLPFLISMVNIKNFKKNYFIYFLGLIVFIFISIYSLQYGGSAEIRLRGVLYVLLSSLIMSAFTFEIDGKFKKKYAFLAVLIFIGGILFG